MPDKSILSPPLMGTNWHSKDVPVPKAIIGIENLLQIDTACATA